MPNIGRCSVINAKRLSSINVSLKLSSTILDARIVGCRDVSPLIPAMFKIFSSVQRCTISQNVSHVVLEQLKSI